ncbi:MAG: hydrogenase expression/formation protein HypE [Myxococcales bacterium]|nr:hydrogenase expression/formation protein HypE [Myxococcales bacterium]MDD9967367.1 hydrogenase expression/formation protein HypE [Myxococcales bacterium]
MNDPELPACPLPIDRYPMVTMAHGGGGRVMNQLITELLLTAFDNPHLAAQHDGAVVSLPADRLALTTDSFVVSPLEFAGGSIGQLAVYGTANDLAMCGARPRFLTLSLILEEGLPIPTLWREVLAIKRACEVVSVHVVTGDTKVVERGKGDGMFINTSGVGELLSAWAIGPSAVRPGDAVIVTGDLGRHGIAVLAAREGLSFDSPIVSDCGSLVAPILALLEAGIELHCMRDLTRGGLASALNEVCLVSRTSLELDETQLRVDSAVRSACELYGLDPLHVANEGRCAIWLPAGDASRALEILAGFEICRGASVVGAVRDSGPGIVTARSAYGTSRIVDLLSGEQLPRIC